MIVHFPRFLIEEPFSFISLTLFLLFQVSHQGKPIDGGFCSGIARDAPSAYVHQFMNPGVFYFIR